jgi:hypothetical protein
VNTIILIIFSRLFSPSLNLQVLYELLLDRFYVKVSPQFYMVSEPTGCYDQGAQVSYLKVQKKDAVKKDGLFVDNTSHAS